MRKLSVLLLVHVLSALPLYAHVARIDLAAGAKAASVTSDGQLTTFNDGYTIEMTKLGTARRFVVTAPDGRSATAHLRFNRRTGDAVWAGRGDVAVLIAESQSIEIARVALPEWLLSQGKAMLSDSIATVGDLPCSTAIALFVAAEIQVLASCESGMAFTCMTAIEQLAAAELAVLDNCFGL